jgi:hypothetical protein
VVALLCDVPTPERRAILEGYLAAPPEGFVRIGSPFMTAFLLETLLGLDRRAEILARIREDWGFMLAMDAVTCWEQFKGERVPTPLQAHRTEFFTRSHCHAWSAAPAYFLPITVLGAKPLEAGWRRFELTTVSGRPALGARQAAAARRRFALRVRGDRRRRRARVRRHPRRLHGSYGGKEYGAGELRLE